MGLTKKTMEVMKLDYQIRNSNPTKSSNGGSQPTLNEKLSVQANTKVMIANLTKKVKKY